MLSCAAESLRRLGVIAAAIIAMCKPTLARITMRERRAHFRANAALRAHRRPWFRRALGCAGRHPIAAAFGIAGIYGLVAASTLLVSPAALGLKVPDNA